MVKFIVDPNRDVAASNAAISHLGCSTPFKQIDIHASGQVSMCCYTWLTEWCGNLLNDTPDQVLANAIRLTVQDNMLHGKFDHCNDHCPHINRYLNDGTAGEKSWVLKPTDQLLNFVNERPYEIYFNYDFSCNLQCPSCRKGLIVYRPDDLSDPHAQKLVLIHDKVKQLIQLLLSRGNQVRLSITGSGDPFASPLYWSYLKELAAQPQNEQLTIALQTNGVMMTEKTWEEIRPLWPSIVSLNISVDAATEQTYQIVRKGGNFEKLRSNLNLLDQMVLRGDLPNLGMWQTNLIVQRDNFRELKPFVEWQLGYKTIELVWTNLIAQWGHLSDSEYNNMAIWKDGNAMRQELIDILRDPIFKHPKVFLGNMSALVPVDVV